MNQLSANRLAEIVAIIQQAQTGIATQCMRIGALLTEVKDQELYRLWDDQMTFENFCEDIKISRTVAYQCMAALRYFGHTDTKGIPFDRLVQLLPLKLEDPEKASEWVEKAKDLPARGFRDEVRSARGKPGEAPIDECSHVHVKHVCADCGCQIVDAEKTAG